MDVHKSDIVQSLRGRDQGEYFIVIDEDDWFLYLVNGKNRRIGEPKRKNRKHVQYVAAMEPELAEKLNTTGKLSGSDIKNTLSRVTGREPLIDEGGI